MACYGYVGTTEVEMPCEDWYDYHAKEVAAGDVKSDQQWMAYEPYGPGTVLTAKNEPTLEQKMIMTDGGSAEYARDWVYLNPSTHDIAIQEGYPSPSQRSVELYFQNDRLSQGQGSLPKQIGMPYPERDRTTGLPKSKSTVSGLSGSGSGGGGSAGNGGGSSSDSLMPLILIGGAIILAVGLFGGKK